MTFRDVLEQALQDAFAELWPTAGHWDRRTPQLAAAVANHPMILGLLGDTMAAQTSGGGAAQTARHPAEQPVEAPDMDHGTQLPLTFAESSTR